MKLEMILAPMTQKQLHSYGLGANWGHKVLLVKVICFDLHLKWDLELGLVVEQKHVSESPKTQVDQNEVLVWVLVSS